MKLKRFKKYSKYSSILNYTSENLENECINEKYMFLGLMQTKESSNFFSFHNNSYDRRLQNLSLNFKNSYITDLIKPSNKKIKKLKKSIEVYNYYVKHKEELEKHIETFIDEYKKLKKPNVIVFGEATYKLLNEYKGDYLKTISKILKNAVKVPHYSNQFSCPCCNRKNKKYKCDDCYNEFVKKKIKKSVG